MRPTGLKRRIVHLAVASALAVAGLFAATPTPAQASDTCYYGAFCWYYLTYQGGSRGSQVAYTSGWVRMSSLVDNSESSWDAQYSDGAHCVQDGNPLVYLSDTYYSTRWVSLVGSYYGQHHNTFNPISTNYGSLNMNNKFNDIWNLCA